MLLKTTTRIDSFFERTKYEETKERYDKVVRDMILSFFDVNNISLRMISKALHRLGLTLASLSSDQRPYGRELVVALILTNAEQGAIHKIRPWRGYG